MRLQAVPGDGIRYAVPMRRAILTLVLATSHAAGQQSPAPPPAPSPSPPPPASAPTPPPAAPTVVDALRAEAAAVRPLVDSDLARAFLDATAALPAVQPRTVWGTADRSRWYTAEQAAALGEAERAALTERTLDEAFYWNTRYGSPVAYARAIDIAAHHGVRDRGSALDFGCGGLGAPRLLACTGWRVTGVDVDPLLPAFYSERGDTGVVMGPDARGVVQLIAGQWPADAATVEAVSAATTGGLDLFLSKNTLKRGYIHPSEPTDPRRLVHLGVDDATFVKAVFEALAPGGLFLVYNICPAPAPAGQPYIPWADGHCPFPRELLESTGFDVLAYDSVDDTAARAMGHALGWNEGEGAMDLEHDLFAWFTVARRPVSEDGHK